jgi:hypothetical protein
MSGGNRTDPGSRLALQERVVKTLERSAQLAERHARRHRLNGRSDEADYEWERARRARQLVVTARVILRVTAESAASSRPWSLGKAPPAGPTAQVSREPVPAPVVADHARTGIADDRGSGPGSYG